MKPSTIINTLYKCASEEEEIVYPTLQEMLLLLGQQPSEVENMNMGKVAPKHLTNDRKQKKMLY